MKRPRAVDPEDRNVPKPEAIIPPGFLSPSVQEYLELGKSIPGNSYITTHLLGPTFCSYKARRGN